MKLLDSIRDGVRSVMRYVARALNSLTGGRLSPNTVTIVGLLAHLPIAWLIAQGHLVLAGLWLIVFGLFDTLDGELARLQKRASPAGMFLDSVTDRMKEVIVYMGIGFYLVGEMAFRGKCGLYECFIQSGLPRIQADYMALFLIAVLGGSIIISYINAWGEAVMSRSGATSSHMNKAFRGGLASFEIRMTLIVLGLLTGNLAYALLILAVLVGTTILYRLYKVLRELSRVQS